MIAFATPVGSCFVTVTYGDQVEYQCEADHHVESELKCGSNPEGCHAKDRAEPVQLVQTSEDSVNAVSSCRHIDPFEERFAPWIGRQDQPFWRTGAALGCDEMSQWAVLATSPPCTRKIAVHASPRRTCPRNLSGM